MKSNKTASERRYHARVAELPCAACNKSPVQVHHIRVEMGTAMKGSHWTVIPLCGECHLGDFSIHKSKRQFENIYGSELDLLAETIARLNT